eukprot:TRINITY_DN57447_c0_g1_i2.p1 TRINITY_DN57447_c0_g1~~TRINITY_DN57447_c0_g1_i2.p1  ORF type:complete len:289 (-),score=43.82 TRINITY_DN57447_c0_g1_i2:331-1197(-)
MPALATDIWLKDIVAVSMDKTDCPMWVKIACGVMLGLSVAGITYTEISISADVEVGLYVAQFAVYLMAAFFALGGPRAVHPAAQVLAGLAMRVPCMTVHINGCCPMEVPLHPDHEDLLEPMVNTIRLLQRKHAKAMPTAQWRTTSADAFAAVRDQAYFQAWLAEPRGRSLETGWEEHMEQIQGMTTVGGDGFMEVDDLAWPCEHTVSSSTHDGDVTESNYFSDHPDDFEASEDEDKVETPAGFMGGMPEFSLPPSDPEAGGNYTRWRFRKFPPVTPDTSSHCSIPSQH